MKVAYVKWFDSVALGGSTLLPSEVDGPIIVDSAGILVKESDDSVAISIDAYSTLGTYRYVHVIPRANIMELRVTDPADMRKRNGKRG